VNGCVRNHCAAGIRHGAAYGARVAALGLRSKCAEGQNQKGKDALQCALMELHVIVSRKKAEMRSICRRIVTARQFLSNKERLSGERVCLTSEPDIDKLKAHAPLAATVAFNLTYECIGCVKARREQAAGAPLSRRREVGG
jgi:hypothetical protein